MTDQPLNVYHVKRVENPLPSYDEYSGFVVVCKNKDIARRLHPNGTGMANLTTMEWEELKTPLSAEGEYGGGFMGWLTSRTWVKPECVRGLRVTCLGPANPNMKAGVVMTHFIHG